MFIFRRASVVDHVAGTVTGAGVETGTTRRAETGKWIYNTWTM